MSTVLLACEVLRPELELLLRGMPDPPPCTFLEQGLHKYPDRLRGAFQEAVSTLEQQIPGPLTILCGYGLCGMALRGVCAKRATLVFPRLHDCIPLLLGMEQQAANDLSRDSATYWVSPGALVYFMIRYHLEPYKRQAEYEAKYGPVKAARMIKAEEAMFVNYRQACHIRWPEMGESFVDDAKKVAAAAGLPYTEVQGSSGYLAELVAGGRDPERFLRLAPGQSIDMDVQGTVCMV